MESAWLKYGIMGLVIAGLIYVIKILRADQKNKEEQNKIEAKVLHDSHKEERKEWKVTTEKQFDKIEVREKETNQTLSANTNVLTALKTLLESKMK